MVGGYVSDAMKRQKLFVIAAGIIAAVGLLVMAFAQAIASVFVATVLLGIGTGLFFAIDLAICVRVLPNSEEAGKDLAIINIANSLPQSIVLGVVGAVAVLKVPEIGQESGGRFVAPLVREPAA